MLRRPLARTRSRYLGRGRSNVGAPGTGGRGGRMPRDAPRGAARMWEDDARRALARNSPGPLGIGGPRRDAHLRSGGGTTLAPPPPPPPLSGASPVDHRSRFAGRGEPSPAGRNLLRPLRRAVPRRILRIPRRGPGSAAAAGRIGRDTDLAIRPPVPVPVPVPAARGDQSVPVRKRGPPPEDLPVFPAAPRAVLEKVFRAPP